MTVVEKPRNPLFYRGKKSPKINKKAKCFTEKTLFRRFRITPKGNSAKKPIGNFFHRKNTFIYKKISLKRVSRN